MSEYTIVHKVIGDNKIRFIDNIDTYQLLCKLNKLQEIFNVCNSVGEDFFLVEYKGYIWDCTDINRLIQIKESLVKEYAKELKYEF